MFIVVWKFCVKEMYIPDFIDIYGKDGDWVKIFKKNPEFIETDLIRDRHDGSVFLTIDKWKSMEAYNKFLNSRSTEYMELDLLCEQFTINEEKLGEFSDDLR